MDELEKLEKLQQEKQAKLDKLPKWIYYDEKGNTRINASQLGYEIMEEVPMIRCSDLSQGARFDKTIGAWRMDSLSDFLDSYITTKLEKAGRWSQQKMSETKKFILIKIFDSTVKDNPFNHSKPYLTNFRNGTYNILTNELKPHDTKDLILQSHNYDIAPMSKAIPEKTIQWLCDLTNDMDSAKYLMEMIGYCFYRDYSPFQAITILEGTGQNGKSTFLNLLIDLLGHENVSNMTLQDLSNKQNRFATSNLYQKEANIFADLDNEFLSNTGILKALTGKDTLMAERKGVDGFMFTNFAKLIFSANELPPFSDFSTGFQRRLNVVPFDCIIDDAFMTKHNLTEIRKEIPVFALYCMQLFNEALKRKELTVSKRMQQAKERWLSDSNHVLRFIDEECTIDMESSTGEFTRYVYEAYQQFCYKEGLRELSQPKFAKQLEKIGIYKKLTRLNGTRARRYIHLQLKNKDDTSI